MESGVWVELGLIIWVGRNEGFGEGLQSDRPTIVASSTPSLAVCCFFRVFWYASTGASSEAGIGRDRSGRVRRARKGPNFVFTGLIFAVWGLD